jgi:hypothetical protein
METAKKNTRRVKRSKHTPIEVYTGGAAVVAIGKNNTEETPCEFCKSTSICDCPISIIKGVDLAPIEPEEPEASPQPPQQNAESTRPSFTSDNGALYRELLLERPATPTITNIQEAVAFVEVYGRWSKKVQVAFR